jgi:hypothetical protein
MRSLGRKSVAAILSLALKVSKTSLQSPAVFLIPMQMRLYFQGKWKLVVLKKTCPTWMRWVTWDLPHTARLHTYAYGINICICLCANFSCNPCGTDCKLYCIIFCFDSRSWTLLIIFAHQRRPSKTF